MGVYDENSQWLQLGFAREKLLTETILWNFLNIFYQANVVEFIFC